MSSIQVSSSWQSIVLTQAVYYNNLPAAGTQVLTEECCFLVHKALHGLVLALTVTRERKVGAKRKLG